MRIAIGADHVGYELKSALISWLQASGHHQVVDVGAHQLDPGDDYPDFAVAVARVIKSKEVERGILFCGSGVGTCITANKVTGIRACVCHDTYTARQGVEHDGMNVICVGARVIGVEVAYEVIKAYLAASFIPEPRFQRRLDKMIKVESEGIGSG